MIKVVYEESELEKKLKKQEACSHHMYVIKCSLCGKVIGSELREPPKLIEHDLSTE